MAREVDLAVVGPMARSAADLVLAMDVIAGPDEVRAGIGYRLALPAPRHDALKDFRVLVVDEHPLALLGVAFGTGVMLATTGATGRAVDEVKEQIRGGAHNINNKAGSALDGAINAVVGAAMTAIASRLSEAVEGALQGTDGAKREQRGTSRAA